MATLQSIIETKLSEAFRPERMMVINESHLHAGHQPGFEGQGESHMRIRLVSPVFAGMSRVERHRAINRLLQPELGAGLHALAIEPHAPGEPVRW